MKKLLVASSALAAVAFAGQAYASEPIKLSVGGYMEQWMGVADQDRDSAANINAFQSDTEVHFKGSTTLDNGIEVGAVIELEGQGGSSNQVDEQYLYVNGGFGQVRLGADDSAADSMAIVAPFVGMVGVNDEDLTNWVDAYAIDTVPSDGDAKKFTYYTPILGGFRAGFSYTDDSTSETNNTATEGDNVVSGGLEYNADFNGWSLGLSAVGENKGEGNWYSFGTNVGFGNFTVGGSYGHLEGDYGLTDRDTAGGDTDSYDIGVAYAMDAAKVSLSYAYADYANGETNRTTGEMSTVDLGLAYTLGAGVTWKTSVFWFDDDNNNNSFDNEGYGAVTGLRLDF
ncbi:porin [Thalassospira sp.]|uniref:porin n=1 Tax=Thalassospira sp. TaxID=1912094 RepID=UPI00273715CC|nr:porin [Thalassospira sp.]MDP2699229.1 porin [Thalassospira sp.]